MIGERLGKWIIYKELGRGGMGRVYLAQEEIGGRRAALKVLAAELAQDPGFLYRFQREIETLSQLDHPHIVRFYEAGFENNVSFYAMEYVEGESFEELLERQGRLPWTEVVEAARQICPALKHVHDHGIIHRDLKPPNLMRTADGGIKLMDFGIAKVFASKHLTATGGIVGTAEYLSPEQAAGKPVTKRSDLYSLGVVFYTLLTGRTPFDGPSFVELLHKHRYGQFDRPRKLVPEIPYELDDLVCQLLEKDPARRPADCLVLGRQFEALFRRLARKGAPTQAALPEEATVIEPRAGDAGSVPGAATLMSRLVREELERQNRAGLLSRLLSRAWLLCLLLALIVGVLVWTFWPPSAESLFEQGSALMQSSELVDKERAWRDYFEPLERRFPDHAYQESLKKFRQQLEEARTPSPLMSEGQRLNARAEQLVLDGRPDEARAIWQDLAVAFRGVEAEKEWVARAERRLAALQPKMLEESRRRVVKEAVESAAALPRPEAEEAWAALQRLYASDAAILPYLEQAIQQARAKLK